jgi:hypothetical protein
MSKIEVDAIDKQSGSTLTLGGSGTAVTLACGATQTGFGRTGTVNWQTTVKTGDFTAANGEGYFVNTTSGGITMTLPASPSAGNIVSVKDYAGTFDNNNLTVGRNGSNFNGGSAFDPTFDGEGAFLTFIYADATKGWLITNDSNNVTSAANTFITATGGTITTSGDFKIHTFTGPGSFCVSAGSGPVAIADYMVVAGGGSGGPRNHASGGGAGGFRESKSPTYSPAWTASPLVSTASLPMAIQSYPITVGGGGSAPSSPGTDAVGVQGSNSVFSTISSAGGGGAASGDQSPASDGGSGGGMRSTCGTSYEGSGNTPPVSPPQGNNGGAVPGGSNAPAYGAGGGGGATAVGGNGTPSAAGAGGAGATTSINGTPTAYAGGGGGSKYAPSGGTGGAGGTGGGGAGGAESGSNAVAGTTNTGGGGGGAERSTPSGLGGNGGSGIVIIRYKFQ